MKKNLGPEEYKLKYPYENIDINKHENNIKEK